MEYEETPPKTTKGLSKAVKIKAVERLGTPTILWLLVKRHKVGLLAFWAGTVTVFYLFPFVPDLLLSVFRG